MRPENTSPNFSAKERIIYGTADGLQFFNNMTDRLSAGISEIALRYYTEKLTLNLLS